MHTLRTLSFAIVLMLCAVLALPSPRPSSAAPAQPAVSVVDCGAKGDGEADDTGAFLSAIAQAKKEKRPVYVPRGTYLLSKPLDIENTALVGPEGGAWPADMDALPVLVPTQRNAPCIIMHAGAGLRGICITYKWAQEPTEGPPAVRISGVGAYISNVKIMYAWDGIIADGTSNVGRLNVENTFLVAIRNVGVRVTGTWDAAALRNVEVWNEGPGKHALTDGVGFELGKNDLIRITDCFAFAMGTGFLLTDEIPGCTIKGGTWGVMNGCATDYCPTGISVQGSNTISISGGTFWDHGDGLLVSGSEARVRLTGAEFRSNGAPAMVVKDCDHIVVTGCSLLRLMKTYTAPAVSLEGGRVVLNDNDIEAFGPGVHIGPSVRGAIVKGNLIQAHGHAAVEDEHGPTSQVLVEGNVAEHEEPAKPDQVH